MEGFVTYDLKTAYMEPLWCMLQMQIPGLTFSLIEAQEPTFVTSLGLFSVNIKILSFIYFYLLFEIAK